MQTSLFQPLRIGPREARNPILFGSHTTNFAEHNLLSPTHASYYAARATGGAGIVVLEEHIIHPSDLPYERAVLGYLPETPQAIAKVVARIHAGGALALVQLNHNGQQSNSDHNQRELWAPSAVQDVASREIPKAMEPADITAVIEGFGQVARYAVQGDADGIELQIADRSLLRQFLSPLTNQRTDAYGGTQENRLRFIQETLEAVDKALGSDRILGVRLCADELAPWAGLTPEQGIEIARQLVQTGRVDYLTITMGSIFSTQMFPFHASMHVPRGYTVSLAAQVKTAIEATGVPVFAAGRIMDTHQAADILASGQADGVEMIRALIAEPHLPRLSQEGRADEVRPCIACNQGCQVRGIMNVRLACNVNPDVVAADDSLTKQSQERDAAGSKGKDGAAEWGAASLSPLRLSRPLTDRSGKQTCLIIGGGPAGMEAARTAALRGLRVVLYEREKTLGGTVTLAAQGPGRTELRLIIDYLQRQLEKLEVEVQTGTEATAEMILAERPVAVVVATGAQSGEGLLPIPGRDLPHVIDARQILRGESVRGKRVVVIDETEAHGVLSAIELLASQGHEVEIVSEDWYVGKDLTSTHDIAGWMQRALGLGVVMTPHTSVVRIEEGRVIATDRFLASERAIEADAVILGTYDKPAQELYYALKGQGLKLLRAGDCIAPRRIEQAIFEGRQAGMQC